MAKEAIFIGGSIAIGAAILGALFLVYPDFMFGPSASSSGVTGADTTFVSPQDETMTAGDGSVVGNSTNNTAADTTAPYAPTQ